MSTFYGPKKKVYATAARLINYTTLKFMRNVAGPILNMAVKEKKTDDRGLAQ